MLGVVAGSAQLGVVLPAIGDAFMGGFYAGIIDTTLGNIAADDQYQAGKRYALIVAPKSLETSSTWGSSATVLGTETRWDGLSATAALVAAGYAAGTYPAGLTPPVDAASAWYTPAMDELQLIYANLKPTAESNSTTSALETYPSITLVPGVNPSSSPTRTANTSTVPAKTTVAAFQEGAAEALGGATGTTVRYRSATESRSTQAWIVTFSGTGPGSFLSLAKTTAGPLRPVRRIYL